MAAFKGFPQFVTALANSKTNTAAQDGFVMGDEAGRLAA